MKLKYYLRGAGIGFIVSAILFASFLTALDWGPRQGHNSKQEASIEDEKLVGDTVKEAEEKKNQEETTEVKPGETKVQDIKPEIEEEPKAEPQAEPKPEVKIPTETKTDEDVKPSDDNTEEGSTVTGNVKFSIKDGEASNAIAKNLQSLGLVDDAAKFDEFLSENGYDHHLRTGEFNLSTGMSYKDLAEELTKKK